MTPNNPESPEAREERLQRRMAEGRDWHRMGRPWELDCPAPDGLKEK